MPENLIADNSIICEILPTGSILSYLELVDWVKKQYSKIVNIDIPREIKVITGISHKKKNFDIPPAEDLLKQYSIDFSKLIVQTSFWVSKEIFDFITKNNKLNAPGVFYPYAIRKLGAEIQNETPHWKETDTGRSFIDLNFKPQNALAYSLVGKSFQAAFSGYTCCHIYGGTRYTHDWKAFTCVANLVLIPKPLQSLTDHDKNVVDCLKQISFHRYNWKPDNYDIRLDDRVKDLLPLVKEIRLTTEQFSNIWHREIIKYRESYKNTFHSDPDF